MMRPSVIMAAAFLWAWTSAPARATCTNLPPGCPSCTQCDFQPVTGTTPSDDELNGLMDALADNALGTSGPELPQQEQGPDRTPGPPRFPCVLMKAIVAVESDWRQFCEAGLTVISFDCGYGLSQVTSDALLFGDRIASEPAYNLGAGASILLAKWNADQVYGGRINQSTPTVVEDWYYATWAYNSFSNRNNPHNPNLPSNRPPFGGPGSLSRASYPYQELVWGRMRYPLQLNGQDRYPSLDVTYPALADIPEPPATGNLFQQDLSISPAHDDPCPNACIVCDAGLAPDSGARDANGSSSSGPAPDSGLSSGPSDRGDPPEVWAPWGCAHASAQAVTTPWTLTLLLVFLSRRRSQGH